jgi:hypothetical protein
MKRRAAAMARGDFLVELDHDDDIHPELFQWLIDADKQNPDAAFFYTDCCELSERSYKSVSYGEFFAMGYSGHYHVWSDLHNKFVIGAVAPIPNPRSITHIVGVPNHVRIWRTSFYDKIGKHNPLLSVADDYELLLRSYIEGKWCHIRNCAYYQYRNEDGNFTFIRNGLIQHNVAHIQAYYKSRLPEPHPKLGPCWKFDEELYPKTHYSYDPNPIDTTILLVDPTREQIALQMDSRTDTRVVVIGPMPLAKSEIPTHWRKRLIWWDLRTATCREDKVRYAKKLLHWGKEFIDVLAPTVTHAMPELVVSELIGQTGPAHPPP